MVFLGMWCLFTSKTSQDSLFWKIVYHHPPLSSQYIKVNLASCSHWVKQFEQLSTYLILIFGAH